MNLFPELGEQPVSFKRTGCGGYYDSESYDVEWLTPPEIIERLGPFDLDPCSPIARPWDTARVHYTRNDDGLKQPWSGRVWMNPPYGRSVGAWMAKLKLHGNGIALIFARLETDFFFEHIWNDADALLFIRGRLTFYRANGKPGDSNSGAPSVLVAYGKENAISLERCAIEGKFIQLKG